MDTVNGVSRGMGSIYWPVHNCTSGGGGSPGFGGGRGGGLSGGGASGSW